MGMQEREKETTRKLGERFSQWGVEIVLVDLDTTLVDTTTDFQLVMLSACGILLSGEVVSRVNDELRQPYGIRRFMGEAIRALRPEFKVNPAIMEASVILTARRLGLGRNDDCVRLAIEKIHEAHTMVPLLFSGAIETVDMINAVGVSSILATHSQEHRARRILRETELAHKFGTIICFDVNQPKSEQWEVELGGRDIDPRKSLVIGDSWGADIKPVIGLGGRGVLVGGGIRREEYVHSLERGERDRVLRVNRIDQVIEALLFWDHP